ncbi:MAG: hypothetical protein ACYCZX_20615 [Rhodospirillaceae bacterium]
MRAILVLFILLLTGLTAADARHRHGHRHGHERYYERYIAPPASPADEISVARRFERGGHSRVDASELIPPGWQLQAADPKWKGKRFVSPDGSAWFAVYSTSINNEPPAAHMKAIAFVDGEEISYVRAEQNWIAVSGLKGERVFYRKARIACGGRIWHNIAFEYPAGLKRAMDRSVRRASAAVDRSDSDGCEAAVAADKPQQEQSDAPDTTGSAAASRP